MKQTITTILLLVLTASAYTQTAPSYVPTNGLVAFYPFSGNINDVSGNNNNGISTNTVIYTTDHNGNSNAAITSLSGGRLTTNNTMFNFKYTDSFTIAFWFIDAGNFSGRIVSTENPEGNFRISSYDGGIYAIQFGSASFYLYDTVPLNQWNHIVYTFSNRLAKLYKNGVLKSIQTNNTTEILNYGSPFTIGTKAAPSYDSWIGKIDDVGIWNRALTTTEITTLYSETLPCTLTTSTTNISICPNALPYSWNGLIFNAEGSQTKHLTNAGGCDSAATLNLTVTAQPTPAANTVCVGSTIQLINATSGGVWASTNNRATVNATGLVTGANAGGAVITYKKNGVTTTYNITVNAIPNVPSIVYAAGAINPQLGAPTGAFCINKTFGVVGIPSGGVFTTGNNAIITINCSGVINTVGLGYSSLNYRYTNAQGCSNTRTMVGTVVNCAARSSIISDKLETANEFSMYPNPARNTFTINSVYVVAGGQIAVSNLMGKQVKLQPLSLGNNVIDVTNLSKGFYLVSVITNEGKQTQKLIIE